MICRGLDDIHTVNITLSLSRIVVIPAVVRKKKLRSGVKVDTDMVAARLAKVFIWKERG